MRYDSKRLLACLCIQLSTQTEAHKRRNRPVAESGQLSVRPCKIHFCTSRNVHKATNDIVYQVPFMVGWLKELGNIAESVCQFLNAVKEKNKIPSNEKSEEV